MKLRRYRSGEDDPVAIYRAFCAGQIPMVYLGMWRDSTAARAVLEYVWSAEGIAEEAVPRVCRLPWFYQHRLSGLITLYRNSPYLLLSTLYPGRWQPLDFAKVPVAGDLRQEVLSAEGIPIEATPLRRRRLVRRRRAERHRFCIRCSEPLPEDYPGPQCERCKAEIAAARREERRRRREQGLCTIIGCDRPAAPGRVRCEVHTSMETFRRKRGGGG